MSILLFQLGRLHPLDYSTMHPHPLKMVQPGKHLFFLLFSQLLITSALHAEMNSKAVRENMIKNENTSFEAGLRGGAVNEGFMKYVLPEFAPLATQGIRSLKLAPGQYYDTKMIRVTPGKSYQWSFDVCAPEGGTSTVVAACMTVFLGDKGIEYRTYGSSQVSVGREWKRIAVQVNVSNDSIPWAYLHLLSPEGNKPSAVLVDAMCLCETNPQMTDPLPYVPAYPVEASLATPDAEDGLFNQPGMAELKLTLSQPAEATLVIRDALYGNEVPVKLEHTKDGFTGKVNLPAGSYLADATVQTTNGAFHVYRTLGVANHRPLRPHTVNPMGAHFVVTPSSIQRAKWLGFESLVYLNQGTYWNTVAPQPHQFTFTTDEEIALTRNAGVDMVVHLSYPVKVPPTWLTPVLAGKGDWGWQKLIPTPKDRHHWREYVKAMATHYRGQIKHWEILSEPNGVMSAEDYVPLLKEACEAIKEADPGMTVVGISSTWDHQVDGFHFVKDALKLGAGKYLDVLSMHPYTWPKSAEDQGLEIMLANLRKERDQYAPHARLWATEWSFSSPVLEPGRPNTRIGNTLTDSFDRNAIQIAAYYVRAAMIHLSEGFERTVVMGAFADGIPPYVSAGMTWVDYNNTPLPCFLAWHEVNHQIVGCTFERNLVVGKNFRAKVWKTTGSAKLLTLWRIDNRSTELGAVDSSLEVCDMLGRPLHGALTLGETPLYINGPSDAVERLAQQLIAFFRN